MDVEWKLYPAASHQDGTWTPVASPREYMKDLDTWEFYL